MPAPGSPRSAFAHRPFRWVFCGSFASNIGTWMQNVALIAFADRISHDPAFVGIVTFAQLGPMLLISPFGGVLADRVDRKVLMISAAGVQMVMSLCLAVVANTADPSRTAIVLCVLGIGLAAACNGPAAQATLPALVGRADLPGAVSLNSAQMNASRVLGPLLAVLPFLHRPSVVFAFNAATYLFVIAAVAIVKFDSAPVRRAGQEREGPLRQLVQGIAAARQHTVIARVLITVSAYSLFSLVFIYQMKGFSREVLQLPDDRFGLLFATFGIGAAAGAIAVGTTLSTIDRTRLVRAALGGFAIGLTWLALLTSPPLAFPLLAVIGFCYFVVITSLSTALQEAVADDVRGRVMGLWMMGWAGLVPVGSLIAGYVIRRTGYPPVLIAGAVVAAALIGIADLSGTTRRRSDPVVPPDSL